MEDNRLKQAVTRYIKFVLDQKDNDQSTERKYMLELLDIIGDVELADIQRRQMSTARDSLLLRIQDRMKQNNIKGNGQVTCNRHLARWSHFFTTIEEWGLKEGNPCKSIKRYKESKGKTRFLTAAEIISLLSECNKSKNKELYLAVLFMVTSGARKTEVLTLTYEQINYEQGYAILTHSKNGSQGQLVLHAEVAQILKSHRRTQGNIFTRKCIDAGFKMACKRAGIDSSVSLHTLRHTFASSLAMYGSSTIEIAEAMRLKTFALTYRYAHLCPSRVNESIKAISAHWGIQPENRQDWMKTHDGFYVKHPELYTKFRQEKKACGF